jgi:hypothetical protein
MTIEDGHIYAWPTNGHILNFKVNLPVLITKKNGTFERNIGLIDVTKYELKECSKYQAYDACWKFGGFRNKWDIYNHCYREDLTDGNGEVVDIIPLSELTKLHTLSDILAYCDENDYAIINK